MATGDLTHAGIYSLEGSQWAVSKGFPVNKNSYFLFLLYIFLNKNSLFSLNLKLSVENVKSIVQGIRDSSSVSNGITIGPDKYIFVNSDPGSFIVLKKSPNGIVAMATLKF